MRRIWILFLEMFRDNAYCGNGYAGQRIFVLPEQDACIAVTAHEFNSGSISDCVEPYRSPAKIKPYIDGSAVPSSFPGTGDNLYISIHNISIFFF